MEVVNNNIDALSVGAGLDWGQGLDLVPPLLFLIPLSDQITLPSPPTLNRHLLCATLLKLEKE